MRIIKPHWPLHLDEKDPPRPTTIYSLSIHPDGSRLATGALDQKIRIWSTVPITHEQAENDEERCPKLLTTLTSHSGAVMCVRWSESGAYLASGSDDKIVMVSALDGSGRGGKVWGSTETNVENWKPVKRLVGHDSDVAAVGWAPDDAYLASVGLDSTVFVYSGRTFEPIRKLDGHLGFVKGLVFDPVGQYLATQSDDNTLKVWRTDDWALQATISAPFVDAPKSNVVRPSWSPEGTHIVTPNSMSGKVFVAAVVERNSWTSDNSMVGHADIVQTAAFNPLLFVRDPTAPASGGNLSTMIALGSRSEISIWSTAHSQPFLVLDDVFERDVLDLEWSKDGLQLWACSSEGHVACLAFSLDEFPPLAPAGAKEAHHATTGYKKRTLAPLNGAATRSLTPFGGPTAGTLAQPNALQPRKGPGAKRIVARPNLQQPVMAHPQQLNGAHQPMSAFQAAAAAAPVYAQPAVAMPAITQQDGPYYADDRRLSNAPHRLNGPTLAGESQPTREVRTLRPSYLPDERPVGFRILNKRDGPPQRLSVPAVESFGSVQVVDGEGKDTLEFRNISQGERQGMAEVIVVNGNKTLWTAYLPSYVVAATGSPLFTAASTEDGSLYVWSPVGTELLPVLVLESGCSFLEAEGKFLMAITASGQVHVWDVAKGESLFARQSLESLWRLAATEAVPEPTIASVGLQPNGMPVLALDSGSTFTYAYALGAWSRLSSSWFRTHSDCWESRRGAVNQAGRGIVRSIEAAINDILVNQDSSADPSVDSGIVVDGEDPPAKKARTEPAGVAQDPTAKSASVFTHAVSLAHLEQRIHTAALLDSPAEYKQFVLGYAKLLAESGYRSKAEELARELLGPVYYVPGRQVDWADKVCQIPKRELLKDVLAVFAKSRLTDSIATDYSAKLKAISAAF